MGLGMIIHDFSEVDKDDSIPWTPEARKFKKEIMTAVLSAAAKIEKFTGIKCEVPPYKDGDENEFLTKES